MTGMTDAEGGSSTGLKVAGVVAIALAMPTLAIAMFTSGWDRLSLLILIVPVWLVAGVIWVVALLIAAADGRAVPIRASIFVPGVVLSVAALSGTAIYGPSLLSPTAAMSIRASATGTALKVEGETDLPDGSLVYVRALQEDMIPLEESRELMVTSGTFSGTLDLDRWPIGLVLVGASFGVDDRQPPLVAERFGPNGEFLRGPGVNEDSDGLRYLSASTEVFLAGGLPSGDPRVLQQPATVIGLVQDQSNAGIIDATVACSPEGAPLTSGEQPVAGGAYLCVVQPGRYTITARAKGYTPQSVVVDLVPGSDRLIDFTMQPVP